MTTLKEYYIRAPRCLHSLNILKTSLHLFSAPPKQSRLCNLQHGIPPTNSSSLLRIHLHCLSPLAYPHNHAVKIYEAARSKKFDSTQSRSLNSQQWDIHTGLTVQETMRLHDEYGDTVHVSPMTHSLANYQPWKGRTQESSLQLDKSPGSVSAILP